LDLLLLLLLYRNNCESCTHVSFARQQQLW
jgi:hypothetical protein